MNTQKQMERVKTLVKSALKTKDRSEEKTKVGESTSSKKQKEETVPLSARVKELTKGVLKAKTMDETKAAFDAFRKKPAEKKPVFITPPKTIEIPKYHTSDTVLVQYWLNPPHAYATIIRDRENRIRYIITEPKLTEKEYIILEETFEYLRTTLILDTVKRREEIKLERDVLKNAIRMFDDELDEERTDVLIYFLYRNFMGYGKLDALLKDERIEDITCNGHAIPLYLYHRDYGNIETNCIFEKEELNKFVLKLAQKADKQLSLTTPLVDAALPDGSRAQITYSDVVSAKGSSFTIRKFKADPMTPAELVRNNTYSAELLAHIWLAVENRKSMIVAGGTASGKTSTMNAVSFFIPSVAKIVSIEDTCEIQLPHGNWLSMKTREAISSKDGSVTMFSLLKAALRQRPEYIIVGEVRGSEAQTLFQAMNTGHTTFSTLHAGNVNEAVNRLTHDPINVPVVMFDALDLIVVQSLLYSEGNGFRRSTSLNEISVSGDTVTYTPLFEWNHVTDTFEKVFTASKVFDRIAYQNGWSAEELQKRIDVRRKVLEDLGRREKVSTSEMVAAITELTIQEALEDNPNLVLRKDTQHTQARRLRHRKFRRGRY
ncbi:MAG TPA: type II/IV secretion system ATPase subunit [Methanocorpusculum sp.]|nr:type II/IV secretion system ATPase subunit [Methanocorpusculum sp.]HJJ40262.1 type II/IV secretion system ATPase subunit [Methanocorpusculum sp.]HJJ49651.1 type II/IV secretion system ATPase subunit [Methanocorpusculum sp.]HJJ57795.1 type II/IV secretion system ATPase subunit [Methanocorpusculum sp.]